MKKIYFAALLLVSFIPAATIAQSFAEILPTTNQYHQGFVNVRGAVSWNDRVYSSFGTSAGKSQSFYIPGSGWGYPNLDSLYSTLVSTSFNTTATGATITARAYSSSSILGAGNQDFSISSVVNIHLRVNERSRLLGSLYLGTRTTYQYGGSPYVYAESTLKRMGSEEILFGGSRTIPQGQVNDIYQDFAVDTILDEGDYVFTFISASPTYTGPGVFGLSSATSDSGANMTLTPVPEPATMTALTIGTLALIRRRRAGGAN